VQKIEKTNKIIKGAEISVHFGASSCTFLIFPYNELDVCPIHFVHEEINSVAEIEMEALIKLNSLVFYCV